MQTTAGIAEGLREDGLAVFKGLPYAAPPVDALRWRAPQPAKPWQGVRKADAFGRVCMQAPGAARAAGAGDVGPLGEDCLSLNIWTAETRASARRPVMVWIHGGALVFGAGSQTPYAGNALAERGAVVVTLNHRLGPLGFFDHPALAAGSSDDVNFGLLDQIAALKWVRDNIAAFGGDPGKVTVFGESAGGQSVLALFASPKARGLFHRGIVNSADGTPSNSRAKARVVSLKVAASLGADEKATAAQLRAIPQQRFATAFDGAGMSLAPSFVVGDASLPDTILASFQKQRQAKLPLIIGSNSDEATVAAAFGLDTADVVKRLGAGRILLKPLYPGVTDDAELGRQAVRDLVFTAFAKRIAYLHAQRAPTWRYYFSHVQTGLRPQPPGVGHGSEIAFVMGTGDSCRCLGMPFSDADRVVSRTVGDYWFAFARNGMPTAPDAPAWPKDATRRAQVMEFTDTPTVQTNFMQARLNVMIGALKGIGGYLGRKE